jgi:hypothetical protein
VHYPALRDGKATIEDLVRTISEYLMNFALPRRQVNELTAKYGIVSPEEFMALMQRALREAKSLFIKANKVTNRNGEGGELLLYILTEWILEAPQLLAKMPLKTSAQVAVHGADGVHVKYCHDSKKLSFFWGESKLYADVQSGIASAAKSIADALNDEKLAHEFSLISRYIDFSGLSDEAQTALLSYLDPNDEHSNERINITTCLIGFDFAAYAELSKLDAGKVEEHFRNEIMKILPDLSKKVAERLVAQNIAEERFELFFFPVPSVQDLRNLFQAEIGWTE